jgi:hypothetical protein
MTLATRSSDMANIDQYIADAKQAAPTPPLVDPDAPTDAVGAPTIGTDTTGAKIAPQAEDHDEQAVPQDADTGRASIREMERTQVEQAQQRRDESTAAQAARQAVQSVSDTSTRFIDSLRATAGKVSASVGAVPIPGDLITPLSILLIFFFALVVINGHTRLSWLWLVLSGNASITTGGGGSFAPVTTTGQTTPVTGLPKLPTPPVTGGGGLVPLATILPFAGAGEPT